MSKYAFLGLFFTVLVVLMGGLTVNHISSTNAMQEIDVGLESAALGVMRESDGESYGVKMTDLQAELTAEIAEKQSETDRIIVVSFKYFDINDNLINYTDAMDKNLDTDTDNDVPVYSVQYKVDLYKEGSEETVDGKVVLKDGVKPQSSTENRISLNKN